MRDDAIAHGWKVLHCRIAYGTLVWGRRGAAMIEIQCTSCHTRYRIDERVLPADSPTFKCSRCGHVFTTDPMAANPKASAEPAPPPKPATPRVQTPATEAAKPEASRPTDSTAQAS